MRRARNKEEKVFGFQLGDRISGLDTKGVGYQGTVELIDKKHRMVWIQTEAGERKLIDSMEYSIERCC